MADLKSKILTASQAEKVCSAWRASGEKVVFTNGVFDLLHPGHVFYLEEAKLLGNRLVVGLNSDLSAKQLNKGDHRPINDEQARAMVLAALESVDAVVFFSEDTPTELIQKLKPDVLVKGGDYAEDEVAGGDFVRQLGGQVCIIPFVKGYSTTLIEQKIIASVNKV